MAAPSTKTNEDLNGTWALNKSISDTLEPTLALQGVGYFKRKAAAVASIVLVIRQYEGLPLPPNEATHQTYTLLDITQTISGLASSKEKRCLDGEFRQTANALFGEVNSQNRWAIIDEISDDYLKQGWESAERYLLAHIESPTQGWKWSQVWGFQVVDGKRRYCRKSVLIKDGERREARLVYDYQSD